MGFGAGLAGFANGLNNGLDTGARLSAMVDQHKLAKVREQGIAEAQAMQAKAAPQVVDNGDMQNLTARPQMSDDPAMAKPSPVSQGLMAAIQQPQPDAPLSEVPQASRAPGYQPANPMAEGLQLAAPKRFTVGNKEFDDKASADAQSKSEAPDLETFYAKTLVPRMRDKLMEMGKVKEAEAWETYAEDKKTKGAMKTWSKAFAHAQSEDYEGAATELMKLYPDYEDGFELVSSKKDTGPNGEQGFTMVVKDEQGQERTVFHDAKTITEVGLQQLSPIEMFNQRMKRQTSADMLQAKSAEDARNDERTLKRSMSVEEARQKGRGALQESRLGAADKSREDKQQHDMERDAAKAQAASSRVKQAAELRTQIKKGDDPAKMRLRAYEVAAKNPMWATMDEAERETEAKTILEFARAEQAPAASAAPAGTVANPFEKPKGVPVFRDGKITYR